jgi:hypothetical protein
MSDNISYIKKILSSIKPLPARKQRIGTSEVAWWEGKPGDAVIIALGGSVEDRVLAEKVVAAQLEGFGYKRAGFYFADIDPTDILDKERSESDQQFSDEDDNLNAKQHDRTIQRQDNWNDLVDKAKRIVNSGNVTLIRNSNEYVVGRVQGDHGNYESEITRQDPESQVITGWHCTCPWNQYAWQRTRQWKVYEGRPCSHVLALYYVAKQAPSEKEEEFVSRPPDLQGPPKAPAPVGEPSPFAAPTQDAFPGGVVPSVPEGPRGLQQLTPFKPEDVGAMDPNEILEQRLGPLAPQMPQYPQTELTPEEQQYLGLQPPQKIQTPPLELLKEQQRLNQPPAKPGESPYGQASPPGTVSVPGIRQPNERNPFGSIWSNVYNGHRLAATPGWYRYKSGDSITLAESAIGIAEGPINAEGVGAYQEIPAGSVGEVQDQDPTLGFVEAIFPLSGGAKTPTHVRCFLESTDIVPPSTKNRPNDETERRDPDKKQRPFGT